MNKECNIFKNIISVLLTLLILGLAAGTASAAQAPVDLGTAGNFVILSKTGISTTGTTSITGDIGVSPVAASYITGFDLIMDSSNQFSTSSLVTGKVYAADYTTPTPAKMTTAISDMETAYTDAAGRTNPTATELYAGDVTGKTIPPGLYKWGTGVLISAGGVTLSGGANDVWIFQIAQDLTVDNGAKVTLSGGAQAKNIFWQVAGKTTLGTTSDFKGIILSKTLISMNTGATLNGRALAQTEVTLIANTVTAPSSSVNPTNTPTITSTTTGAVTGTSANPTVTSTSANPTGTGTTAKQTVSAGTASAAQAPIDLGTAGNFAILAKSGITNVPTSAITGDIGTSPITGAAITGLGCPEVTGKIYTVNPAGPACRVEDPALLTTAVSDMETAYTAAAGRTNPTATELYSGDLGGRTLAPGLYKWTSGVTIPTDVTLSGGANDVWIFQIAGTLDISPGKKVILSGGAQAKNIFWQVAGATTLGTTSVFNGNILAKTNIALKTGSTLNGRALAQTAVTLEKNTVNSPSSGVNPTNTPTVTSTTTGAVTGTPTYKVPGFELVLIAAALYSVYLFSRKRR